MVDLEKSQIDAARARCYELLPKVSRSFALAIEALPEPVRGYVCAAYLLCRLVDTIEDHPTLTDKPRYYEQFDQCLFGERHSTFDVSLLETMNPPQSWDAELTKDVRLVFQFYYSFSQEVRGILKKPILEMSQGMRSYTDRGGQMQITLNDTADLDRYCYFVAGTVGHLLTGLFAHHCGIQDQSWVERQSGRGYHFALGLQKVNIIKDVVADMKRGSVFVPQEWLKKFELNQNDLMNGAHDPRTQKLLRHFITNATEHLAQARDYILDLPASEKGLRLFCIWPYAMALDTLRLATEKSELFTENHEIKVSRPQMFRMMALTKIMAPWSIPLKFYLNCKISQLKSFQNI